MTKIMLSAVAAVAGLLSAGAAEATPLLDQQAAPFGGSLYEAFEWQQGATAGLSGLLSGLTLYGAGTSVTVRVNAGDAFYAGPYAFSQTVQLSSGGTFVDTSAANIQLASGQSFVIDLVGGSGGNIFAAAAPYAGGHLFLNFGVPSDFTSCCNTTLAFQTFMEPSDGAAVPEPAAWAMMLLGFGGMGAVLRRGRRAESPLAA